MKLNLFGPSLLLAPILATLGTVGLATHGLAQQNAAPPGMSSDTQKTGAGPRGTKVAPSSNPTLATNPASPPESTTGVGSRGNKAAPSTEPGAPTNQTPQQTR
jgi:hypothetical protein